MEEYEVQSMKEKHEGKLEVINRVNEASWDNWRKAIRKFLLLGSYDGAWNAVERLRIRNMAKEY